MKYKYLPIKLTYNILDEINVEALFAEMSKEIIHDFGTFSRSEFNLTSGFELFVFKKGSVLSEQILKNPREIVELSLEDFKTGTLNFENETKTVYYHTDIMKEIVQDNWTRNFQYANTIFYSTQCRVCLSQTDMVNEVGLKEINFDKKLTEYLIWKFINFKKAPTCSCGARNYEIKLGKFVNGEVVPLFQNSNLKINDVPDKGYLELFVDKKDNKASVEIGKSNSVTTSIFKTLLNTVEKVTRFLDSAFDYKSMLTSFDNGHYYVLISFELTETTSDENKVTKTITSRVEKLSYLGFDPTDIRTINYDIFKMYLENSGK